MTRLALLIDSVVLMASLSACSVGHAGGAADIGRVVDPAERRAIGSLQVAGYDQLLSRYVDDDGGVDYADWHRSDADRKTLETFLWRHSEIDPARGSREQRIAFWINAYNALTLHGILREYPTDSIRDHTAKLFGYNIWDDLRLYVAGKLYSLNDIEHNILRRMNEPRIHFAIVCASKGCPRLLSGAYTAGRLEEQLESNAKQFFAQRSNFHVDGRTVYLSSILDWFGEDFGASDAAVLKRIGPWLPGAVPAGNVRVRYTPYDWGLNRRENRRGR